MEIDLSVSIPKFNDTDWNYKESVSKCHNLYTEVRRDGSQLVIELFHVHEMLVNKQVPNRTWGGYCAEIGISRNTIINWFNKHHLSYSQTKLNKGQNLPIDKPSKKHTKPDTKLQLDKINKEINENSISDDDIKILMNNVADKIENKKVSSRVGTRVQKAVRSQRLEVMKKNIESGMVERNLKPIDNFYRLKKHILSAIEGLTYWADKTIKPETQDEAECAKIIMASAANNIIQYARLGIDVQGIYSTFIEGKDTKNGRNKQEYIEL